MTGIMGKNFYQDQRHVLYREYLRIVAVHQPPVFVMENVKGILSSRIPEANGKPERIFPTIRKDLAEPCRALEEDKVYQSLKPFHPGTDKNYNLFSFVKESGPGGPKDQDFVIRCEDYGIPQNRHRVILLGIREDIDTMPRTLRRSSPVALKDVLQNLPALRSGLSKGEDSLKAWQAAMKKNMPEDAKSRLAQNDLKTRLEEILSGEGFDSRGQPFVPHDAENGKHKVSEWMSDRNLGGVLQHETRAHMASDLGRYLFASLMTERLGATPKLQRWPVGLLPKHRNVTVEKGAVSVSGFDDRLRAQAWDKPSATVTSHISKDGHYYIHPDPAQCRSLTVREAARLQTFPDNYFFCGNRTQQYHQIGNAVPPFPAAQLASVVADILEKSG